MALHRTIPIFIPELACPHRCIYCNQFRISGQNHLPSAEEVRHTIETHLSTFPLEAEVEIGFFGGTFTALSLSNQCAFLDWVQPYLEMGRVRSIRLSTRPDCIELSNMQFLKQRGVETVELGVQSLDEQVLRRSGRGYDVACVERAADCVLSAGLRLGMQMMIGLPDDSKEAALHTADRIVRMGALDTRIYPTLVVKDTALAKLFEGGLYCPLSLEEAVDWTKDLLRIFDRGGVTVLRVGLHPTEGLLNGSDYLAGPFHVSFRELAMTALWKQFFEVALRDIPPSCTLTLHVAPSMLGVAAGYGGSNRRWLMDRCKGVRFVGEDGLQNYEFWYEVGSIARTRSEINSK